MKRYLKHIWAQLWQNKLYGVLYLLGTALPVTLTMVVVMYLHLLTAPIYPELHRDHLYEVKTVTEQRNGVFYGATGSCSLGMVREWFYPLRSVEAVTAIYYYSWGINDYLQMPDGESELKVKTRYTDGGFFRVFDFQFVDGGPFVQADVAAGRRCAVLPVSMARRLFGTEHAAGKHFSLNYIDYTVVGVVRDASSLTPLSFAQVWLPYSCMNGYSNQANSPVEAGGFTVVLRTRDDEQARQMQAEIRERVRKYNVMHESEGRIVDIYGPLPAWKRNLAVGNGEVDFPAKVRLWGGLLLAFLLVPAVNLGSIISGRMEERQQELGVSKAFGASRSYLLRQVVGENLLMTLGGGLVGLLLSWLLLWLGHDWVIALFDTYGLMRADTQAMLVTPDMLFSPVIFLIALLVCVVLNLASALIPAWRSLRVPIVQALNEKKK